MSLFKSALLLLKRKSVLILMSLIVFATVLHVYKLGEVPSQLNPDEASIGYNALLLKETGKDEWGKKWPLVLDAFGDQKLIGYPALVAALFTFLPYSDAVVKLPSLIAGSVLILLIYLLQRKTGYSKKQALLGSLIISIVPVFFFYSRVAFEAMVALGLLLSGFLLLLKTEMKRNFIHQTLAQFIAVVCFLAALFIYNTPFLLLPIIVLSVIIYLGIFNWKKWLFPVLFCAGIWIFFALNFLPLTEQKSKITLFGDPSIQAQYVEYRQQQTVLRPILGNKVVFYSQKMFINYISSWSPGFLLKNQGGHPWHTVQGFGYLTGSIYLFGLFGVLVEILITIKMSAELLPLLKKTTSLKLNALNRELSKKISLLFLFFASLAPVIITVNAPQATRSLLFLFLWCHFAAVGVFTFARFCSKFIRRKSKNQLIQKYLTTSLFVFLLAIHIFLSSTPYMIYYFTKYAHSNELQAMFQPGLSSALSNISSQPKKPLAIVDERGFNYILVAWYLKTSPDVFFQTVIKQNPDRINFKYGEQLAQFHFVAKAVDRKPSEKSVLFWDMKDSRWKVTEY